MSADNIIALDAMGGDNAPASVVFGADRSAKINKDLNFIFWRQVSD